MDIHPSVSVGHSGPEGHRTKRAESHCELKRTSQMFPLGSGFLFVFKIGLGRNMHRNTVHFRKSKGFETTGLLGLENQKGQRVMWKST